MTAAEYLSDLSTCLLRAEATGPRHDPLPVDEAMARCVARLRLMREGHGDVHLIGNGGSAAIVAHAQNDFVKAAHVRARIYQDVALQSAYENDLEHALALAVPVRMFIRATDVLVAVSSSGASANILKAVEAARMEHAVVITLSGFAPTNRLRRMGDLNFYVPSSDYGQVELTHAALLHHLTDEVARA